MAILTWTFSGGGSKHPQTENIEQGACVVDLVWVAFGHLGGGGQELTFARFGL